MNEQHFRNAVTTILVDHGVIRPLASLILDLALPVWTWDLDGDTMENVSPQSTPQTIVTNSYVVGSQWTNLQSNRPLGVGDRVVVLFDIPDSDQTDYITICCTDDDDVGTSISLRNKDGFTNSVHASRCKESQHRATYLPFGDYKGKVSTLKRVVLSRNDQEIHARILFRDQTDELDFLVDTPEPHTIVFPKITLFFDVHTVANPSNWTITLANFLN